MHQAHHKSFTIAKVMRNDLLLDIQNSLLKAQEDGIKFAEWQKRVKPMLIDYGWYGATTVTNPSTGEIKNIFVGSRRLKNIFNTNMRVSYSIARYHKLKALPFSKYWMYVSMLLPNTRGTHRAKHGKVLERSDPWWSTNYPPNAWGCKCKVRAYSKKQLEKKGVKIEKSMGEGIAKEDWAYDVGAGAKKLEGLRNDGIDKLPKALRAVAREELKIEALYSKAIAHAPLALQTYLFKNRPKIKTNQNISTPATYLIAQKELLFREEASIITVRHELGHHVDNLQGFSSVEKLKSLKVDQLEMLKSKYKDKIVTMLKANEEAYIHDLFYLNSKGKFGIETRDIPKKKLFDLQAKETFANIFEILLSGNKERLAIVKNYFPNAFAIIEKILKEL